MVKVKHTEGPWTINPKDAQPIIGLDVGDGLGLIPIVSAVGGAHDEMIDANIRLISASPDLFEVVDSFYLSVDAEGDLWFMIRLSPPLQDEPCGAMFNLGRAPTEARKVALQLEAVRQAAIKKSTGGV
jgi:hypothetical protein